MLPKKNLQEVYLSINRLHHVANQIRIPELEFMQKNLMKKIYGFDNIEHQLGSNLNLILAKVFLSRKKVKSCTYKVADEQ